VQQLQCRKQATSHPENQFQPTCQLMTTVTQFQKPGARDANNSNPVSNSVNGNEILRKNIQILHKWERSSAEFSTIVIRNLKVTMYFKSNTFQTTQKVQYVKHDTFTVTQFSDFFGYRPDLITFFAFILR
jgi:hypothetical protein